MKIAIEIGTVLHILEIRNGEPDLSEYPSAGQKVLQAAYDAGMWAAYTLPDQEFEGGEPNWQVFRLELMVNPSFRDWAATLPADWREDLKGAAILGNAEALQATYTHVSMLHPVPAAAAAAWQQIADATHIPINFLG